jgi:hypothetical protein
MNPFSSSKGTALGVSLGSLIAVGFTAGLVASELHDSSQPNNGLQAAQPQLVEEEACPYPPQTPAAAGAEDGQPEFLQPRQNTQPASLARPAIYIEVLVPPNDKVTVTI